MARRMSRRSAYPAANALASGYALKKDDDGWMDGLTYFTWDQRKINSSRGMRYSHILKHKYKSFIH